MLNVSRNPVEDYCNAESSVPAKNRCSIEFDLNSFPYPPSTAQYPDRYDRAAGVSIGCTADVNDAVNNLRSWLHSMGIDHLVDTELSGGFLKFKAKKQFFETVTPHFNTLDMGTALHSFADHPANETEREILLSMSISPVPLVFDSIEDLHLTLRIRCAIAQNARLVQMSFCTGPAERPETHWHYKPGIGFCLNPEANLCEALRMATQPTLSGQVFSFSCYRASEYAMLLGLVQALEQINSPMLEQLQRQWKKAPIQSRAFHDTFLVEVGALDNPLPPQFYIPGDRVWFRNPDSRSADVSGYEGSWVIYMGRGEFSNFWAADQPYTLTGKCIEIFHWRHALNDQSSPEPFIDEFEVDRMCQESMNDRGKIEAILNEMLRFREPQGIYGQGGCIDVSREFFKSFPFIDLAN